LGEVRNEDIEEGRGEDRALRDARVNNQRARFRGVIETGSGPPTKIGSKPPNYVGVDVRVGNLLEEKSVVNCVEGFRNIDRHNGRTGRRLLLIEAVDCSSDHRKESGSSGAEGTEAMLRGGKRKRRGVNERKKKAFKNFDYRGKEGDGAVRGTEVKGFSWLRDGDDVGRFPNHREVSIIDREVIEFGEEGNATGSKVFKVKRRQSIRTCSCRVA
jgi:hypothetical protein